MDLAVELYPDGSKLGTSYSLQCDGEKVVGKSEAPDPDAACRLIADNPQALTPKRPHQACTEIYGGPDRALVKGTVNGRQVSTEFTRTNGCYIAEWDALQPLLGGSSL